MKQLKPNLYRIIFTLVLGLASCNSQQRSYLPIATPANETCIGSFADFAFTIPDINGAPQDIFFPQTPWEPVSVLPVGVDIYNQQVKAIRMVDNHVEIWTQANTPGLTPDQYRFLVYRTDSKTWQEVPAKIQNSSRYVNNLYVTNDGLVWGSHREDSSSSTIQLPPLSRFDDKTMQFEFVYNVSSIPDGQKQSNSDINSEVMWDQILIDSRGIFWFFVYKDAIYSYDPGTQKVESHATLANYEIIQQINTSIDGSIYFVSYEGRDYNYLQDGQIYRFVPSTGEITTIQTPHEHWPAFERILLDQSNRLWLDIFGWRNPDGTWEVFHPQLASFIRENANRSLWRWFIPPQVFFESSDGRIWFRINRSSDSKNVRSGIAWFNPKTKTGCWFTSEGANILEDENHSLWMMIDGQLYRHPLNVQ